MNVTKAEVVPTYTYTVELTQNEFDLLFLALDQVGSPIAVIPEERESEFRMRFDDLYDELLGATGNMLRDTEERLGL